MAKTGSAAKKSKNNDGASVFQSRCRVVVTTRIRPTRIGNRADKGPTLGLCWKTKCDRRETIIFVRFLSPNGDRQPKDLRKTIDELKLKAKKTGCTCLTDSLDIVEIEGNLDCADPITTPWWNQIFEKDKGLDTTTTHNQLIYFGQERAGTKKDDYFLSKIGKDTEWSLFLHRINNCNSIEEIVQSGVIPDLPTNVTMKSPPSNYSIDDTNAKVTNIDSATFESPSSEPFLHSQFLRTTKFLFNNSITILHFRNLNFVNLSPIAIVRCARVLCALWNNQSIRNGNPPSLVNNYYCNLCSKPSLVPSKIHMSMKRVARWNDFLSAFFDMTLGFVVCAVLLYLFRHNHQSLIRTLYLDAKQNAFQSLENQIAWLETFPAGFKLNVRLTHNMGYGIRRLLHHQKKIIAATTLWEPQGCQEHLIPVLATLAALGGWTTFLAVLMDLWRLEIFHVTLLAVAFRKLYQAELYLLSALFRLFRGKKRNALRHRTDSMQYDSMQLLVGTIAFCICVFLWTTVMVYYTFFVIWNLLMHIPLMACSVLYLLSRSIPWGSTFFRFMNPHWFPKDLFIDIHDETEVDCNNNNDIQVSRLETILESPFKILFNPIKSPLKRVFQWYLLSFLELLYPRASHTSHSFLPLTLLVDDLKT
mmetsp:Transcript_13781/g.27893  ORF Transcript_13781/g.27893 Transcript_13781/m.27893 type:complete len:644 (+) Transcript_13781:271-2202(+)